MKSILDQTWKDVDLNNTDIKATLDEIKEYNYTKEEFVKKYIHFCISKAKERGVIVEISTLLSLNAEALFFILKLQDEMEKLKNNSNQITIKE